MEAYRKVISFGEEITLSTVTEANSEQIPKGALTSNGKSNPRLHLRCDLPQTQPGLNSPGATGAFGRSFHASPLDDEHEGPVLGFSSSVFEIVEPNRLAVGNGNSGHHQNGFIGDDEAVRYGARICLKHRDSGLFLALFPTQQSELDERYHAARLVEVSHIGLSSYFKVLPRYRIHYDGDPVCDMDHVQLQLFDRPLSFHISTIPGGVPTLYKKPAYADEDLLELNGTLEHPTIFAIRSYSTVAPTCVDDKAKGQKGTPIVSGAAVAMFHRQKEALLLSRSTSRYLKMKGATPESVRPEPILERFSALNDEATVAMSLNQPAGCVWALEPYESTVGGTVQLRQLYRFRQVATGKYLAINSLAPEVLHKFTEVLQRTTGKNSSTTVDWALVADAAANALPTMQNPDGSDSSAPVFAVDSMPTTLDEDIATLFILRRTEGSTDTGTTVTSKLLVRLQHAASGLWLGTGTSDSGDEFGEYFTFKLHRRPTMHDALTLVPCMKIVREKITYLAELRADLDKYVSGLLHEAAHAVPQQTSSVASPSDQIGINVAAMKRTIADTISALGHFARFCTDSDERDPLKREGMPIVDHQHLLFDIDLHQLLFQVILSPFTIDVTPFTNCTGGLLALQDIVEHKQYKDIQLICRLAYRVLKQMVKGSSFFAIHLTPWIPIMHKHNGLSLHVADTLLVVFNDNPNLSFETCQDAVRHYVKTLQTSRSAGYIKSLAVMCTAAGKGLVQNQEFICKELLVEAPYVLMKTALICDEDCATSGRSVRPHVGLLVDPRKPPVDLAMFLSGEEEQAEQLGMSPSKHAKLVKFFCGQLEFFGALSFGNRASKFVATSIEQYLPKDHMQLIVKSIISKIPAVGTTSHLDGVASNFIDLCRNLFVREEQFLEERHIGCGVSMAPGCTRQRHGDLQDSPLVRSLKEVTFDILKKNSNLIVEHTRRNELLVAILSLWGLFVSREQYAATEVDALLPILLNLLDGSKDLLSLKKTRLGKEWNRYAVNEQNQIAMLVKEKACGVVSELLKTKVLLAASRVATQMHEKYENAHTDTLPPEMMREVLALLPVEAERVAKDMNIEQLVERLLDVARYDSSSLTHAAMALLMSLARVGADISDHTRRVGFFLLEGVSQHFFMGVRAIIAAAEGAAVDLTHSLSSESKHKRETIVVQGSKVINFALTTGRCPWVSEDDANDQLSSPMGVSDRFMKQGGYSSATDDIHAFSQLFEVVSREKRASEGSSMSGGLTLAALAQHNNNGGGSDQPVETTPPDEVAPPVLLRGTVMQHWNLPSLLIPWLAVATDHRSEAFKELIEAIYTLVSGSMEAALVMRTQVHRFLDGIRELQKDRKNHTRRRCIQIVMAILNADKYASGAVDRKLLVHVFERIQYQAKQPNPDATFLKMFNDSNVGTHMAPHNQKFVLETLHASGAFHITSNASAESNVDELEFNAALLRLIANCCIGNSIARHIAHRILSAQTIMDILSSPTDFPVAHRASYYRLLGMLYFVFDDESHHERRQLRLSWTVSPAFWNLMEVKAMPRLHRVAAQLNNRQTPDADELTLVFSSIIPTLCCYLRDVFDTNGGNTVDITCSGMDCVAQAVVEVAAAVADASSQNTAKITSMELIPLNTLLPLLKPVLEDLDMPILAEKIATLAKRIKNELETTENEDCNDSIITGLEPDSAASHIRKLKRRMESIAKGFQPVPSFGTSTNSDGLNPQIVVVDRFLQDDAKPVLHKLISTMDDTPESINKLIGGGNQGNTGIDAKTSEALFFFVRRILERAEESSESAMEEQQERFNEFGFVRIAVELTGVKDHDLLDAAVQACVAAVKGGNSVVQDALLEHFTTHNERFFLNLKNIINVSIMNVRRENQQWAQLELLGRDGDPMGAKLVDMSRDKRSPMYSLRHIDSVIHLLQQLCEGHHIGLQNYIRNQFDNLLTINMPKLILDLAMETTQVVNKSNIEVISRMFSFFTEICQGPCAENQGELLRGGICSLIATIFRLRSRSMPGQSLSTADASSAASSSPSLIILDDCSSDVVAELHASAATTLLAILEGNEVEELYNAALTEVPLDIIEVLMQSLRPAVPLSWTEGIDTDSSDNEGRRVGDDDKDEGTHQHTYSAEDAAELLFKLLVFLKQVRPHTTAGSSHRTQIDSIFSDFEYLAKLLGCIEIQRGKQLEKIYFKIPRVCLSLTEQSRHNLLWSVDRSTRHTKLSEFMAKADELIFEMEHAYAFKNALRRISAPRTPPRASAIRRFYNKVRTSVASFFIQPHVEYYETVSLVLAVILNVMFVLSDLPLGLVPASLQALITPSIANGTDTDSPIPAVLAPYLPADLPEATEHLHFQSKESSFLVSAVDSYGLLSFNEMVKVFALLQVILCTMALIIDSALFLPVHFYRCDKERGDDQEEVSKYSVKNIVRRLRDASSRVTTVYRASMVGASVLAFFVSPLFLCLHLLGLINKSTILANVIIAITRNGRSLIVTMGLGVIIVYIFSIFGLAFFPDAYSPEDEGNCSSLQRCFVFILMNGLRQGGGIGDAMKGESWGDRHHTLRMIHDFVFFATMNIVFMNILFGIIIDTFAELRDDKQSKEEDMQTCCFVCGISSDDFEQAGHSFETHVKEEHNMWQYLYFIHHLRCTDHNEYNGQESYVADMVEANELHFFPSKRCLVIQNLAEDEGHGSGDEDNNDGEEDESVLMNEAKKPTAASSSSGQMVSHSQSMRRQRSSSFALPPASSTGTPTSAQPSGVFPPSGPTSTTTISLDRSELASLISGAVEEALSRRDRKAVHTNGAAGIDNKHHHQEVRATTGAPGGDVRRTPSGYFVRSTTPTVSAARSPPNNNTGAASPSSVRKSASPVRGGPTDPPTIASGTMGPGGVAGHRVSAASPTSSGRFASSGSSSTRKAPTQHVVGNLFKK